MTEDPQPQSLEEFLAQGPDQEAQEIVAEVPYIVTEAEIEKLAEALAQGNASTGKGEVTREDLTALVLWATGGKLAYMLFYEVMEGNLNVTIENGEPVFGRSDQPEANQDDDS